MVEKGIHNDTNKDGNSYEVAKTEEPSIPLSPQHCVILYVYGCLYVSMNIRMCESCTKFLRDVIIDFGVFPDNRQKMKHKL